MNKFNDTNFSNFPGLPRMHFKGQSQTTTRNIPKQTAEEKVLQDNSTNFANSTMDTANNILGNTNQVVGDFGNVYGNYKDTSQNVNNGYTSLLNGELPSSYAQARQQALNSDLDRTVGSKFNDLNSRGIFGNSTITRSAMNDISRNASDTMARNFSSDMSNYAGILGNTSANNTSNLNNFTGLIGSQLNNANNAYNNTGDLFKTMFSGRHGVAGETTTTDDGGASMFGALGSAAVLCFAGGTKVSTPDGEKNIEDIKLGDQVNSIDGVQTVIFVQEPCISNDEYMTVIFDDKEVTTTAMQTIIINGEDFLAHELPHIPADKVLVYDFSTTGSNTYYANGYLVRGR